jgi:transcriptional regulator with XRE-family HTH domain
MFNLISIGKLIRKRRKLLQMTIEELAEKSQSSTSLISLIERGKLDNIKIQKLNDIAVALDLNLKDFFLDSKLQDPAILDLINYLSELPQAQRHEVAELLLRLVKL